MATLSGRAWSDPTVVECFGGAGTLKHYPLLSLFYLNHELFMIYVSFLNKNKI